MNETEYRNIQEALNKHLSNAHGYSGNKAELFREGIRTAMSVVHTSYKHTKPDTGEVIKC